jgi:glycosyltransferase involved in cell wall biosynthesis
MKENNHPLVSFLQMSYNQEQYIVSSIKAALAQTYSPMEIIISDDASTDNSWQLIQDLVSKYNGPHKIIISRNENNLGILGNWNKLCSMANGELLVKGDGDDISFPNRVERTVKEWLMYDKKPMLISSSCGIIDLQDNNVGELIVPIDGWDERDPENILNGNPFFHPGSSSASNRILYDTFGPCTYTGSDIATYVGRAIILGQLVCIRDKLLQYRVGSGYTTGHANYRANMSRSINHGLKSRYQCLEDLQKVKEQLTPERYEKMKGIFERSAKNHKISLHLWRGKTFKERLSAYKMLHNPKLPFKVRYIQTVLLLSPAISKPFLQLPLRIKKLLGK